jgi:two-component system, response regulator
MPLSDKKPVEILLVEDNPNDVELTLHAFEQQHLANRIHVVRDGAEAVDFLFGTGAYSERNCLEVPKLILLDLKLPKLSGVEVLRRIRADPRTKTIPVAILTSSREEKDLDVTYDLGANSYIVKPVEFDQFTEVVAKLGYYWLVVNQQPPVPKVMEK